ncbi:MAG: hypothetical protein ABIJ18_05635 [archaeon]
MIISFYEEFPIKKNIEKINLIKFPTKLYIAATSLKQFNRIKKTITSKYVKEIAYWPILKKKEGYWLSPFSKRKALKRIINELKGTSVPVLWDAELPTHQHPSLYFTQLPNFFANRKLIRKFVKSHKKVYVVEYFFVNQFLEAIFTILGISFPPKYNTYPLRMAYSSMHDFGSYIMNREIKKGKDRFGNKFIIAYGVLAKGILGWEKPISAKLLERDLKLAKKHKLNEVAIFRLGGLNKEYIKIIEKYSS